MCCELLVCAACSGRVTDARCSTCAAARAHVHGVAPFRLTPELVVLLVALVASLALVLR